MSLTQQQFETCVRDYGPILRRVLLRLTRGRSGDADDLLQRTYERAWLKRDTFRGGEVGPWLRGIARYEHLNHLRRRGQQFKIQQAVMHEVESQVHHTLPKLPQEQSPLISCIQRLTPQDQYIVNLFYGRNEQGESETESQSDNSALVIAMTDKEVAAHLTAETKDAWSPDRVRTRRHRALKQLRKCLQPKLQEV